MEGKGLLPDLGTHFTRFTGTKVQILTQELRVVTYSTLIKAYERAGQWERALEVMKVIVYITHMYVYIYMYIYSHMYTHIYIYTHVCVCVCVCVCEGVKVMHRPDARRGASLLD